MKANNEMTAAQIRASLAVSEETLKQAERNLEDIFAEEDLPAARQRPYLAERKKACLDLIADILAHRFRLRRMLEIKEKETI